MPNLEICSCGSRQCDGCADCELCGARVLSEEMPDDDRDPILCEKCLSLSAQPQGTKGGSDADQVGPSPSQQEMARDLVSDLTKDMAESEIPFFVHDLLWAD